MLYNNEFKEINNLEKSYLLGLWQADGTLIVSNKAYSRCTKLKLKEEDKYLLEIIHNKYPFFTKPKLEVHKSGKKSYYIYSFNKNLFNDLYNNGILPRKSFENANKSYMPNLSKELFFAYLHGLFDGDGTISMDKYNHIRIDLVGKNKILFKKIIETLALYNIKAKLYYRKSRDYYMIRISIKESVQSFINNCKNTPFCLKRKFPKYFNIDWTSIPDYKSRGLKIKEAIKRKNAKLTLNRVNCWKAKEKSMLISSQV